VLLILSLVVLALGLVELGHFSGLPLGSWLSGSTASILSTANLLDLMRSLGYVSLFVLMTLESASVPIPSEVVLPFAGYLVFVGVMDFYIALLVALAASVAGALIDYYAAYFLGRPFVLAALRAFGIDRKSVV